MPEIIQGFTGADIRRVLTLCDRDGVAITTYTSSAALAAECSPGGGFASLFAPAVSWSDAPGGKVLLAISGAQTSSLAAGQYPIQLSITASGVTAEGVVAVLDLRLSPGDLPEPDAYCSLANMLALAGDWGQSLLSPTGGSPSNFADQRLQATRWLDDQVIARAEEILDDQSRRHAPVRCVSPIFPLDGLDAGPSWGQSIYPDTTRRDQLSAIRGHLAAGKLMCSGHDPSGLDGGDVERIAANYALWLVLRSQVGSTPETPYQLLAKSFRAEALRLLAGWTARIDTDDDGVADYEIE